VIYELRLSRLLGLAGIVAAGCHSSDTLTSPKARCGMTPTLVAGASSYTPDGGAGINIVGGMAVDGSDLYFSVGFSLSSGALMHVSTSGGAVKELASGYSFQAPVVTPAGVLVGVTDSSSFTGSLLSVPRNGGTATPLVDLGPDGLIAPPVTDGTSVYFVTAYGFVDAAPLTAGASPVAPTQLGSGHGAAHGIAVAGQQVLVNDGEISLLPIGGGDGGRGTVLRSSGVTEPLSLSACGTDACWLMAGDVDTIERFDPVAGTVSPVPSLPDSVASGAYLLFDGTSFFVVGSPGLAPVPSVYTIERIPQQGGAPVAVATVPRSAIIVSGNGIALADACLYVATSSGIYSVSTDAAGAVVPGS
jgi:hypothetical protein